MNLVLFWTALLPILVHVIAPSLTEAKLGYYLHDPTFTPVPGCLQCRLSPAQLFGG